MTANWSDAETKALLLIRADEEICRQLNRTVSDTVTYDKITRLLKEQGINRSKSQVISKLKTLRLKFQKVHDHHKRSGNGRISWAYFELCQSVWGNSHSTEPVALSSSLNTEEAQTSSAESADHASGESMPPDIETDCVAEDTTQPPKKKTKKAKNFTESITTMLESMDKSFREQEAIHVQEQREYEEKLRKEAREEQKEDRATLMAMWREMMEFQGNLLRECMNRPPLPTSYPPYSSHQQQFSFPGPSTSYMAPYYPPEKEASPHPQFRSSFLDDLEE
ncbi:uncharacterized protein [Paramisgurnus dabryanus]|uniref:uncharacterized protein n=1 Tax=Paramisgurnus dabryanus TaxID=90735 RepID=UPI0031F471D1